MRQISLVILLSLSLLSFSQKGEQRNALFTIRGNIGIPKAVSSQMFRTCFAGLYEANLSANLRMFDNFYVGVGYQNSHFQNNKFLKQQLFNNLVSYNTRCVSNGAFMRLGYDKFFSDKGYFGYALNAGYAMCSYLNINQDSSLLNRPYGPERFNAMYVQPEISANFIVDKTLAFSFFFSYTTQFSKFNPRSPRFNQFEQVKKTSNNYVMSWINIGIGFTVLIKD
jgi:hypothetical protein